jgi:hypothetical protein
LRGAINSGRLPRLRDAIDHGALHGGAARARRIGDDLSQHETAEVWDLPRAGPMLIEPSRLELLQREIRAADDDGDGLI